MLTYALPTAAFVAGAVFIGAVAREPAALARPTSRMTIEFDDSSRYLSPAGSSIAVSPDGSLLAMVGESGGVSGILLRRMDETALQLVRGTENGSAPVFSPDGEWLVFHRAGQLVKVSVRGGTGTVVSDTAGLGVHWTDDGHLLVALGGRIYRAPEAGGARVLVAYTADGESYNWPMAAKSQASLHPLSRTIA